MINTMSKIIANFIFIFTLGMMIFSLNAADVIYEGCRNHSGCDDGVFCNGKEICKVAIKRNRRNEIIKEVGVCHPGINPCERGWKCWNREKTCERPCQDNDGDGSKAIACGGDDCDDGDPNRFPGNIEICDARGIDEDCDPTTVGDLDRDGDGFVSDLCR